MERIFRISGAAALIGFAAMLLVFVGPWPVMKAEGATWRVPLERAAGELSAAAVVTSVERALEAGWAAERLILPEGVPLAGYGDRRGEPSRGYHDPLEMGAVVVRAAVPEIVGSELSTGRAVEFAILTSDLLIVPDPVADEVRSRVALPVLFSASHTHSGPGGAMRGLVARAFGGRYDPEVERALVDAMVSAVTDARANLRPVTVSHAVVALPERIRNRTRDVTSGYPITDPYLDLLQFQTHQGERLSLLRYSAHATIVGPDNMALSAGYPGYLRLAFEQRHGGEVFFMAGAVGSMSARAPGISDDFERAKSYAELLAVSASTETPLEVSEEAVGIVDLSVTAPPVQLRLTPWFRMSPIFLAMNGISREVRFTAIRIGSLVLMGFPGDLSGEISALLRTWGREKGVEIVSSSFAGSYLGYISPDAYYESLYEDGELAYETGLMSWAGPGQERFFVGLAHAAVDALFWE